MVHVTTYFSHLNQSIFFRSFGEGEDKSVTGRVSSPKFAQFKSRQENNNI